MNAAINLAAFGMRVNSPSMPGELVGLLITKNQEASGE